MTKGTTSMGERNRRVHIRCRRCGKHAFHISKKRCAHCAYPAAGTRKFHWSDKVGGKGVPGTGRLRHVRVVRRHFKHVLKTKQNN